MDVFSEEEKKKKSVYVYMISEPSHDLKLLRINPHLEIEGKTNGFEDMTVILKKSPPPDFASIHFSSLAAIEPKLYFIGGSYRLTDFAYHQVVSKQVFAFDTTTNRWDSSTQSMRVERLNPAVLTYKNKIFAFGYRSDGVLRPEDRTEQPEESAYPHYYSDPGRQWIECYDPEKDEWNLISSTPPPSEVIERQSTTHAVCEEKQLVFFCSQGFMIHCYKFDDSSWFSVSTDSFDQHFLYWSNKVAVFRSFVFWHREGSVYAHKFEDSSRPLGLFTLDSAWDTFGSSENSIDPCPPPPSFLINAGNGLLCIVYQCPRRVHQNELRFHILEIRLSHSQQNPYIHNRNYYQTHQAKDEVISTVLAM